MSLLAEYVNKQVQVVTTTGRVFIGKLVGFDKTANVVLSNCTERVFSKTGVETAAVGLYGIRGDTLFVRMCLSATDM